MKVVDKYKYWLMLSDYDLDTVQVLIDGKRWVYVAYICQQAIERQLKGMYVYHVGKEAPKSHNLGFLFQKIVSSEAFQANCDAKQIELMRDGCEDFLVEVMFYYMSDYPFSYKNISGRFVDEKTARELYQNTQKYISWLRSLQPLPEPVDFEEFR